MSIFEFTFVKIGKMQPLNVKFGKETGKEKTAYIFHFRNADILPTTAPIEILTRQAPIIHLEVPLLQFLGPSATVVRNSSIQFSSLLLQKFVKSKHAISNLVAIPLIERFFVLQFFQLFPIATKLWVLPKTKLGNGPLKISGHVAPPKNRPPSNGPIFEERMAQREELSRPNLHFPQLGLCSALSHSKVGGIFMGEKTRISARPNDPHFTEKNPRKFSRFFCTILIVYCI